MLNIIPLGLYTLLMSDLYFACKVMRQAVFISTMHDIHWAGDKSPVPGEDGLVVNAIIRYHQYFLRNSEIWAIPSLDVDMVFHTHLLSAAGFM